MCQKEKNNEYFLSNNTYGCAPFCSNESIFFNLILKTPYENTKENCLIFFRNYSKNIIITKRDLFKTMVNELILSQLSNKSLEANNNSESLYLIRICIKYYSRNNIINALYDFILEKDEINNNNNIIAFAEKKEENKLDLIDEESLLSINSSNNKKRKNNGNLLGKKRKVEMNNEDIQDMNNNNKKNKIDDLIEIPEEKKEKKENSNIKKEKIEDDNDIIYNNSNNNNNNVKIKKEKEDFFKRSFFFEENEDIKFRLRNRNKSLGLKRLTKKNSSFNSLSHRKKRELSFSREKYSLPVHKKEEKKNEKKLEENNLRSHLIKKNGKIISYKIMKYQNSHSKKINFLCNNEKCRGKGVYLMDKSIFKETEKHNFKYSHVTAVRLKNYYDMLIKDKNCDGYQILKNGEFIKDKKVIYIK